MRQSVLVLALLALTAGGCAETRLVAHTAKSIRGYASDEGGGYKIGNPYQIDGRWYTPAEDYDYVETGIASWYGADFHGKPTANGERFDMNALTAAHRTLPLPSWVRVTNLENGRSLNLRVNDRGPFKKNRIIDVSRRGAQVLGFQDKGVARVRVEILAAESLALKQRLTGQGGAALTANPPLPPPALEAPEEDTQPGMLITAPQRGPIALIPSAAAALPPAASSVPRAVNTPQATSMPAPPRMGPSDPAVRQMDPPQQAVAIGGYWVQAGAFGDAANAHAVQDKLQSLGSARVIPVDVNGRTLYRVRLGPFASRAAADDAMPGVWGAGFPEAQVVGGP